jgi:hypothetical protein
VQRRKSTTDVWSACILPAFVLRFSGGSFFEFRINDDVPLAGKMPALQTLLAHVYVPGAGKMPALQALLAHASFPRAGKMPALQTLLAHAFVPTSRQDAGAPGLYWRMLLFPGAGKMPALQLA